MIGLSRAMGHTTWTLVILTFISASTVTSINNCTLTPTNNKTFIETIYPYFSKDNEIQVLEYTLNFNNVSRAFNLERQSSQFAFRPTRWYRTQGLGISQLLLLNDFYYGLLKPLLSASVGQMNVGLEVNPQNCLDNVTGDQLQTFISEYLLQDFYIDATTAKNPFKYSDDVDICTSNIVNDNGWGKLVYSCCGYNSDKVKVCYDVEETDWVWALRALIIALTVVLLLYSPVLIPRGYRIYPYSYNPKENLRLKFIKTKKPQQYRKASDSGSYLPIVLGKNHWKKMENFSQEVNQSKYQTDVTYDLSVKRIDFSVCMDRMIQEGGSSVSAFRSLFDFFVRCKIRHSDPLQDCCSSSACGTYCCKRCPPWKSWFRAVRSILVMLILAGPSIPFFYAIAADDLMYQQLDNKYETLGLARTFNFYVGPVFGKVIVAVLGVLYVIHIIIIVVDGATDNNISKLYVEILDLAEKKDKVTTGKDRPQSINSKDRPQSINSKDRPQSINSKDRPQSINSKDRPQSINSKDRPQSTNSKDRPQSILSKACGPIKKCGILILPLWVIGVILLPVVAIVSFIISAPMLRVIIKGVKKVLHRLNLVTRRPDYIPKPRKREDIFMLYNACEIVWFFFTAISVFIVLTIGANFLVNVLVVAIVTVIVEADLLYRVLPVVFLLVMYIRDAYSQVGIRYDNFFGQVIGTLRNELHERLRAQAFKREEDQRSKVYKISSISNDQEKYDGTQETPNTPFRSPRIKIPLGNTARKNVKKYISTKSQVAFSEFFLLKGSSLRVRLGQLLLFFSKNDFLYLSKRFFYECCTMSCAEAPGVLEDNYINATLQFAKIGIFLVFVFLVVMAYGSMYYISPTNHLFVTLVSGLVPLIIRNVFSGRPSGSPQTLSNYRFEAQLNEKVQSFNQSWDIEDMYFKEMIQPLPKRQNKSKSKHLEYLPLNALVLDLNDDTTSQYDVITDNYVSKTNSISPSFNGEENVDDDDYSKMSTTNMDMRRTDRGVYSNDIHRAEAAMTEEEHKREVLAGIDAHTVTNTLMRTFGLIPETDDGIIRPTERRDTGNYSSVPTTNRVIDRETGNYTSVPTAN